MEDYHIVSFSGGKDSTCLLLMMLEKGMQVDEIIFCDTGVEFSKMYDHIKKVEKYIGRSITVLKNPNDFEYFLLKHKKKKGKHQEDLGYGFPRMMCNRWCTRHLKTDLINKYLSDLKKEYNLIQYIGIAADEQQRVKDKVYPLIDWGITEADALQYCKDKGFDWGGLYDLFNRVSCWCCPMQGLSELRRLQENFPDLWLQLKKWETKAYNNFRPDYTVPELEIRFELEKERIAQGKSIKNKEFFTLLKSRF